MGSLLGGLLSDGLGRKICMFFNLVPFLLSWTVIGFAKNFVSLLVGQIILGFGLGKPLLHPLFILFLRVNRPDVHGLSMFSPFRNDRKRQQLRLRASTGSFKRNIISIPYRSDEPGNNRVQQFNVLLLVECGRFVLLRFLPH